MRVAHQGDGIDHGGIILDGSPDTYSDNFPVARVGDNAMCDVHGPVTIVSGATMTRTNGMDTAREFDLLSCGGTIVRNIEDGGGSGVTVTYNGASYSFSEEDLAAADDDESDNISSVYVHKGSTPTPEQIEKNKQKQEEKAKLMTTAKPDTTNNKNTTTTMPVECNMFVIPLDYNMQISKLYKLSDLTLAPALVKNKIVDQRGLSTTQIACNLKGLATNILDPLAAKYGKNDILLTSCFRLINPTRNYVSQHELGQAADIQFPGQHNGTLSGDAWWERVLWIKDNLPYDQFILEYLGKKPWCHVSFAPANRKQLLTFFANNAKSSGLHRV